MFCVFPVFRTRIYIQGVNGLFVFLLVILVALALVALALCTAVRHHQGLSQSSPDVRVESASLKAFPCWTRGVFRNVKESPEAEFVGPVGDSAAEFDSPPWSNLAFHDVCR